MQIVSEKERKIKMDKKEFALNQHEKWNGKIEVISRAKIETPEDLAVAYTPGVAEPCLKIAKDVDLSYKYTRRGNLVAVVTDGTAVLGLGDIGPEAGMPVMEGKCALFKEFGDVDAFPLCIRSKDVDEIVNTVALLAGSFGGINLEDISAPRCFEIERKLKERCDIPVWNGRCNSSSTAECTEVYRKKNRRYQSSYVRCRSSRKCDHQTADRAWIEECYHVRPQGCHL